MNVMKEVATGVETAKADPKVKEWLQELSDARKREKEWRKSATEYVGIYETEKAEQNPFNILYSNTETLIPALYNNLPRPVVQRRFKDEDPLGKIAADVAARTLSFLIDNDLKEATPFDDLISQAVLETTVPGRGVLRFKYDAYITEVEGPEPAEGTEAAEGEAHEIEEQVESETVCGETVPWNRFLHGYAKQWKDVPWVAFEHFFTREELVKNFGKDLGFKIPLNVSGKEEACGDSDEQDSKLEDAEGVTLAQVYEIWHKTTGRVLFLAPSYTAGFVKDIEDPLELTGFFPMPKPLMLFAKISSLVPVGLYATYEEQAKELNRVTVRIQKIISALKVRGAYDSTVESLERVLKADDNELIPAENIAAMQQGQSLEKAIWLMPLSELIAVLQQLYGQRTQIKQVIYEITGISDILRGSSVASETATAQNIKNQWGTLRLKRMQKIVARYVRDCLRIMAEIAMSKLSQKTIAAMTGLNFPTAEQKAQAQQALQMAQAQQIPGQPPQPPDPTLTAQATLPAWEEILGLLSNDIQRNYRIDIETNSTVDSEATEDKQDMGEFLNAVAQFLNGVAPLVEKGVMPFEVSQSILLAVVRRYRFGPEVEDQLKQMKAPAPQGEEGPDPAAEAAKAAAELQLQVTQAETKARMAELEADGQIKQAEGAAKLQEIQRKGELALATHQWKMKELEAKAATPKSPGVTTA